MNKFASEKILIIGVGVLLLFIGIGTGLKLGKTRSSPLDMSSAINFTSQNKIAQETTEAGDLDKSETGVVKVTRVIDGDTLEIEGGERVRYIGIDTPETVDPRKPVQCFGVEASKKNKELVEGKQVRLKKDVTDRDKYNRLLRYVWASDTFVNLELVKQGFAHSYSYPPDIKYQDQFVAAERQAREAKVGLWNICPATKDTAPTPLSTNITSLSSSCVIKGNVSATGEKIYHLPGCGSYIKTQIDENRGERWFCSESEAQTSGWRRALNCQ